jgi:hypothetical protein
MERLVMSKVREVLKLRWALGRSLREAARAAGVSVGVVSNTERRVKRAGLDWTAVGGLVHGHGDAGSRHRRRSDCSRL